MKAVTVRPGCRKTKPEAPRRESSRRTLEDRESLDHSMIAELTPASINGMTRDELVRVICAGDLAPLRHSGLQERLTFYGRETLVRLAHLARKRRQCQGLSDDIDPSRDGSPFSVL